jgi:hypothetical protein
MTSRSRSPSARLALLVCASAACTAAVGQGTAGSPPAPVAQPQYAAPAAPAHGPIPSKSETAMEAYGKLNRGNAGYLTWNDVRHLDGFETAFQQADQNRDGRLSPAEFNSAWAMYTGNNP